MASGETDPAVSQWEGVFSGAVGLWLALALIKFGNPIILDEKIRPPVTSNEYLVNPWPADWGLIIVGVIVLLSLRFWKWQTQAPLWLAVLPAVWLGWQFLSATGTVDWSLTAATLKHFISCAAVFYVGLFAFGRVQLLRPFWIGLLGGFTFVLTIGLRQHFGGFEETRQFFYSLPDWRDFPPEFLKKVASDRIYSTLFYPNALAGAIILLLPPTVLVVLKSSMSQSLRWVGLGAFGGMAFGCLYWSGSKAGWLIVLAQGVIVLLHLPVRKAAKVVVLVLVICGGTGGFSLKYRAYFDKGATSVTARLDYWRAAWQTMKENPWIGSGPGTFKVSYRARKPPDAEMTRLAHSDLLQQGSDSGFVGLFAYAGLFYGAILVLYRKSRIDFTNFYSGAWLGLVGLSFQSLVEFGLYIPALAWPLFFFMGWLLSQMSAPRNRIDKFPVAS